MNNISKNQSLIIHSGTTANLRAYLGIWHRENGGSWVAGVSFVSNGDIAMQDNTRIFNFNYDAYGEFVIGRSGVPNIIRRTMADSFATLAVNNASASTTGNILNLQWQSVNRLTFSREGNLAAAHADGIKIGLTAAEKWAFWGANPIVQPAAIADATSESDAVTKINLWLAQARLMGLIAT
jgi:hypothetical protein